MKSYKGICKNKYPKWCGWSYMALYGSLPIVWDDDKPLQKLVKKHYIKKNLRIFTFNISFYIIPYTIYLIKGLM